jgi:hypothetical protein
MRRLIMVLMLVGATWGACWGQTPEYTFAQEQWAGCQRHLDSLNATLESKTPYETINT